jgi:hypothetical protein
VPGSVGVPEKAPVEELMEIPGGRTVALKVGVGSPVAFIRASVTGTPTCPRNVWSGTFGSVPMMVM